MQIAPMKGWSDSSRVLRHALLLAVLACAGCAGHTAKPGDSGNASTTKKTTQVVIQPDDKDQADQARLKLAMNLIVSGDPEQAIQGPIATVLAHFPARADDGDTRYYSAVTQVEAILYAGLDASKYHKVVLMPREWVTAQFLLGFAYNSMQMYDAAHGALEKAVALAPLDAHILNELGYTCEKQKNWTQAMDTFKSAESAAAFLDGKTRINEETRAIRGQGFVLVELGKLDEAEAAYHRALKLDPGDTRSMGELRYVHDLRARRAGIRQVPKASHR